MNLIALLCLIGVGIVGWHGCSSEEEPLPVVQAASVQTQVNPVAMYFGEHTLYIPPGPERREDVPEDLLSAIGEGVHRMHKQSFLRKKCGGKEMPGMRKCIGDYKIAAVNASGTVIEIDAYEDRPSDPPGFTITCERNDGSCGAGVNPPFHVVSPPGWTVVAIRTPVYASNGGAEGAVYVPYSSRLNTPQIREAGLAYVHDAVLGAYYSLRAKDVRSKFIPGTFVTDHGTPDHVLTLMFTEQMRSAQHFVERDDRERLEQLNRTLVILGANRWRTGAYMRSRVGAAGPMQFMPRSYRSMRSEYPRAELPMDALEGRLDHESAITAAILHTDNEWWAIRGNEELRERVLDDEELRRLIFAGGYNANVKVVVKAIERCGETWRTVECGGLVKETRWYLKKYAWLYAVLFDPDFNREVAESVQELEQEALLSSLNVVN